MLTAFARRDFCLPGEGRVFILDALGMVANIFCLIGESFGVVRTETYALKRFT